MLLQRVDKYRVEIEVKKYEALVTVEVIYILNQKNLNNDGDYQLKFISFFDVDKKLITDQGKIKNIAQYIRSKFKENKTNFIGKTAVRIGM